MTRFSGATLSLAPLHSAAINTLPPSPEKPMRLLLLFALSAVIPANETIAGLVSRDLFEPGDGLITYDEVNQREWLDPRASTLPEGVTTDDLIIELGPGGDYEGFQLASLEDVQGLATTAGYELVVGGIPLTTHEQHLSYIDLTDFFDWNVEMSEMSGSIIGSLRITYGMVSTDDGHQFGDHYFDGRSVALLHAILLEPVLGAINRAINHRPTLPVAPFLSVSNEPIRSGPGGVPLLAFWLYRDAAPVPEPTTAFLMAIGGALALTRRRPAGYT